MANFALMSEYQRHRMEPGDELLDDEDALYEHYTLYAPPKLRPVRIDKFLANQLPQTSRSRIKNASQAGSIIVNGQPVKVSYKLKPGEKIQLMLPYPPPPTLEAEELPINIVYEDEEVIVVHKEPGMVVHPSIGHRSGTLVHGLLWHLKHLPEPEKQQENARPGLVHRLDKDTSGIMVIAKTEFSMAHLSKQFFDRSTGRRYHAIVWGDVLEDEGSVEGYVGRHDRNRKLYFNHDDPEKGKRAVTHYKVLERFGVVTLIECRLETGRTHQIRVQMKSMGHTLFSDYMYGGDQILKGPRTKKYQQFIKNCMDILPRQALHAKTLDFDHPTKKERMTFDSDLPADMTQMLEKMRKWVPSSEV